MEMEYGSHQKQLNLNINLELSRNFQLDESRRHRPIITSKLSITKNLPTPLKFKPLKNDNRLSWGNKFSLNLIPFLFDI
jgi:hypothetical protein